MIQKENLIVKNDVDTQREEKKKEREREKLRIQNLGLDYCHDSSLALH